MDKSALSEEIVTVFYQLVRLLSVTQESAVLEELPIVQARLLRVIDESPGLKVVDLAQTVNLSVSQASRMLAALVERGLVNRLPDTLDKRAVRFVVTEEAQVALRQRELQRIARMNACLEQMSNDTATHVAEMLHLMKRAAEKSRPAS